MNNRPNLNVNLLNSEENLNPAVSNMMMQLRDVNTDVKRFRQIVNSLTTLLAQEALRWVETQEWTIMTPLMPHSAQIIDETKTAAIAILRAWAAMWPNVHAMIPNTKLGWIWLKRDEETFKPKRVNILLPDLSHTDVLMLDPMLATGGSSSDAISIAIEHWAQESRIQLLNILAAPEWVERINNDFPQVKVHAVELDKWLNETAYILPWLWDAWDRIFPDMGWEQVVHDEIPKTFSR